MKLRAPHYRVLVCLFQWHEAGVTELSLDQIAAWCYELARDQIRRVLQSLAYRFDTPLVSKVRRERWATTIAGRELVRDASVKPTLPQSVHHWKDEVLSGMRSDGDPTKKVNPVLSTATCEGFHRNPQTAAFFDLAKALGVRVSDVPDLIKRDDIRYCHGCEQAGRFPFRKIREFGSYRDNRDGTTRQWSRCKRCRQDEEYNRRINKKGESVEQEQR